MATSAGSHIHCSSMLPHDSSADEVCVRRSPGDQHGRESFRTPAISRPRQLAVPSRGKAARSPNQPPGTAVCFTHSSHPWRRGQEPSAGPSQRTVPMERPPPGELWGHTEQRCPSRRVVAVARLARGTDAGPGPSQRRHSRARGKRGARLCPGCKPGPAGATRWQAGPTP